jgi:signal transduction histidine kinase
MWPLPLPHPSNERSEPTSEILNASVISTVLPARGRFVTDSFPIDHNAERNVTSAGLRRFFSTFHGAAPYEHVRFHSMHGVLECILAGGGDSGALARSVDWSATAIGGVEQWPQALRSAAALVLHNDSPMLLWWGPEFVQIYNDAYVPVLGDKHPRAMGQPLSQCWAEVFDIVRPMAEKPLRGGGASSSDDLALLINRKVHREDSHFRVSYSPVPDETVRPTGIGGVLATVTEITEQVYGDRQLRTLRELGVRSAAEVQTTEQACAAVVATLEQNPWDVPFALLYLLDADGERASLAASAGFGGQPPAATVRLCPWPLSEAARERRIVTVDDLSACADALPQSPWSDRLRSAIVLPLASPEQPVAQAVLVCGVSPHRVLDAGYRGFFELVAGQAVTALRNAQALEHERRRAEALAELDRAKTAFFSNVSHEFRTPLTLMLGPQQDALESPSGALAGDELRAVHRNTLRLLRLVNSLLEFSRIEAGRAHASYQPTDLAMFTRDLASGFRSTIERGGLSFVVDCQPLEAPVYVDRGMWEKVVLNLISNAFKFTFNGTIAVRQRRAGDELVLEVADSGVGIPEAELARVFERFHRIEATRGRTHEGSGIGLALVHDMVALHGGSVAVSSREGAGTTFTVRLPLGRAHLPPERIAAPAPLPSPELDTESIVSEAMGWVAADSETAGAAPAVRSARLLVADDNPDMREYVGRLLKGQGWTVDFANDGLQALALARDEAPDLVITDVMMPNLDGFGLLRHLREDPRTAQVPVIVLSARAGEEARVDGLDAGADDYLVKPFSAKELLARVRVQLENVRLRRQISDAHRQAEAAREIAESASRAKDEFLAMLGHELRNPLSPIVTALQLLRMRGTNTREQALIERQVAHLIRLVDDLLDISRITRGKIELRRARTEAAKIILRGMEIAGPLLEQRRVNVDLQVPAEGLAVNADPERLAQVVSNLLTNAAKYSEMGTVVHISADSVGKRVQIRVRDEGMGIEAPLLSKVFDMFFQPPQSLDRATGGLGLGLAIVRSLVEMHGGAVFAMSDGPGKGSEFVVELPLDADPAASTYGSSIAAAGATSEQGGQQGKRILVVDDNADAAESMGDLLEMLGNSVAIAHDGAEALRIVGAFNPEVCIVDIGLPAMDGYELARRLRESDCLARGARLIAVTGYGQPTDQQRSAEAGFDAHLVKPVNPDLLTRSFTN